MRTNIDIDEKLLEEARKIAGVSTKKAAVEAALEKFVRLHRQREALDGMRGLGWEGNLDEMREGRDFGDWK
jgi:Arc/MetJ family transcription regulator